MPSFSARSRAKLDTCDKRLQDLFNKVIVSRDCTILEGHRNEALQNKAFEEGNSKVEYPNSKHNKTPSQAVDVMPYPIDWEDRQGLLEFANFVEGVAAGMGITVEWGGRWKSFFDGPHWQVR